MNATDVPLLAPRLRRPLAAAWISISLHAALLALIQVAPPRVVQLGEPVIEARLVSAPRAAPAVAPPARTAAPELPPVPAKREARLAPSEHAQALPTAPAVAVPPTPAAPPAAPAAAPPVPAPAPATASTPAAAPAAPGITIPSAVDLTYYTAREWGVPPRALRKVEPVYPDAADRERLSGSVRLQLKLEEDGRISDIKVVSASPPGVFEDAAIKAFHNVRFAPAQRNGEPVRALVLITVEFDWAGRR